MPSALDPEIQRLAQKLAPALMPWLLREFYAEGTWTPTYTGLATPGATTYTLQSGSYVRIGRAVLFTMTVVWSAATGTGLGLFLLPFPVTNTANQYFAATCRSADITFGAGAPEVEIDPNTIHAYLRYPTSNAGTSNINVEAAGNVIISGWYLTE